MFPSFLKFEVQDQCATESEILAGAGPEPDWSEFGRNRTGQDFTISKTRPDSTG